MNVRLVGQLAVFAAEHADWLRIIQFPNLRPRANPAEASGRSGVDPWPTSSSTT
ncbi:hypothetical protein AB0C28_55645 [Nonomuraea sp. NPDC048892]|uniref:hypothetical protein n=1 Tax=Nonomuraea sp. NPDC048892 TaxID=3154624 RepID=UPI0033DDF223